MEEYTTLLTFKKDSTESKAPCIMGFTKKSVNRMILFTEVFALLCAVIYWCNYNY